MNTSSVVTLNGTTTFDSNYAQHKGGTLAVSASSLVLGSNNISFTNNSALSGLAMYLMSSLMSFFVNSHPPVSSPPAADNIAMEGQCLN